MQFSVDGEFLKGYELFGGLHFIFLGKPVIELLDFCARELNLKEFVEGFDQAVDLLEEEIDGGMCDILILFLCSFVRYFLFGLLYIKLGHQIANLLLEKLIFSLGLLYLKFEQLFSIDRGTL